MKKREIQSFQDKVSKFISDNNLIEKGETIILGVSGGADSMALLDILIQLGYNCVVAHCNFHLRGEESNRDEMFVKKYCEDNAIKYISISFDTYQYMADNSISLEMAARKLRYDWFEKVRVEFNAAKIAVGHHKDDSIETFLINLTRGSGIKGLTGISPQNGYIIRPLLCLFREEALNYLTLKGISYVNDSTNNEDAYTRNKIRLNIIPELQKINPSIKQSISHTLKYLSSAEKIYSWSIQQMAKEVFDGKKLNISKLKEFPEPQTILFEILSIYGFNSDTVTNIFKSIESQPGKIFYSENYCLMKDRDFFLLQKISTKQEDEEIYFIDEDTFKIEKPIYLIIRKEMKNPSFKIAKDNNILMADYSRLLFPLYLRKWKEGDKLYPIGMNGKKKLSDYFSDRKYNLTDKRNTWLLCNNNGDIIWIVGERMDNRYKITDKTTEILIIKTKDN